MLEAPPSCPDYYRPIDGEAPGAGPPGKETMAITFAMTLLTILAGGASSPWLSLPGIHREIGVLPLCVELGQGGEGPVLKLPVVEGGAGDPAVEAMNAALSWESVTGQPLEETLAIYEEMQCGYIGADYAVNYDAGGILDITVTIEFLGPYPSTSREFFCFVVATGERLSMLELLPDGSEAELAAILDGMLQENIDEARVYYDDEDCMDGDMYEGYAFTVEDLERFSIVEDGVWFHYDFGFPHIALAAEPEGDLFLPAEEILPFLAME